ncbi:MAG: tetratricopeptide repeat protein, partial [Bryobacteraceae bacterium]|nr:tetratricopeptide repeat protein [Bryobacteraceae bacterium]
AGEVEEAEAIFREAANRNRGSLVAQTALANYYFAREKWTEAEEAVKVARALDEKAAAPAMLEVQIAAALGRVEEAERLAGEIRARRGEDPEAAFLLAGYYRLQGKQDQVVAVLERLEQAKPDYPPGTMALAEAKLDAGQGTAAMKLVEKLEQRGLGAEPRTILAKGRALLAFGRTAEALPYLQKAVGLMPDSAHALYARAAAERALGNREQARATLEEAQRKDPRMIGVKVGLANMAADRQDSVLALALANQAVEAAPTSAVALTTLARATLSKGDVRAAEAKVNEALQAEENSIPALTMYVKLSLAQGRAAEAVTRLTALAAKDRGNASLQVLEGLARYGAGDLPGAQAAAERAIQSGPRVAEAHSLLGSVFFQQRDLTRAKQAFAESLRINPRNVNAGLAMLAILEQEGKGEEAKRLGERMRAQDSQSPVIAHQLARLYLEYGGDPNQALALALEARTKMAGSPAVADTVGWAYYKLGQWGPAIGELSQCASGEQASPVCQYHLGLAQAAAGRPTAAAESLNKAIANPKFRWQAEARAALEKVNRKLKPI